MGLLESAERFRLKLYFVVCLILDLRITLIKRKWRRFRRNFSRKR